MQGGITCSAADAARRRARFEAEAGEADTTFKAPVKTFAHPDSQGVLDPNTKGKLMEIASDRLASGDDLSDAQRALLARYGVSLSALVTAAAGGGGGSSGSTTSISPSSGGRGPVWLDSGVHAATSGVRSPPRERNRRLSGLTSGSGATVSTTIKQTILPSSASASTTSMTTSTVVSGSVKVGGGAGRLGGGGALATTSTITPLASIITTNTNVKAGNGSASASGSGGGGTNTNTNASEASKRLRKMEKKSRRLAVLDTLPKESLNEWQLLSLEKFAAIQAEIAGLRVTGVVVPSAVDNTSTTTSMQED